MMLLLRELRHSISGIPPPAIIHIIRFAPA
jgi:hypothetical protein